MEAVWNTIFIARKRMTLSILSLISPCSLDANQRLLRMDSFRTSRNESISMLFSLPSINGAFNTIGRSSCISSSPGENRTMATSREMIMGSFTCFFSPARLVRICQPTCIAWTTLRDSSTKPSRTVQCTAGTVLWCVLRGIRTHRRIDTHTIKNEGLPR